MRDPLAIVPHLRVILCQYLTQELRFLLFYAARHLPFQNDSEAINLITSVCRRVVYEGRIRVFDNFIKPPIMRCSIVEKISDFHLKLRSPECSAEGVESS